MRTITNDYRDAQILNLGAGSERGPYLVTQTGVAPRDRYPRHACSSPPGWILGRFQCLRFAGQA
jgi:hypothetical protein